MLRPFQKTSELFFSHKLSQICPFKFGSVLSSVKSREFIFLRCIRDLLLQLKSFERENWQQNMKYWILCFKFLYYSISLVSYVKYVRTYQNVIFSESLAFLALIIVIDSITNQNWRSAISHVWQFCVPSHKDGLFGQSYHQGKSDAKLCTLHGFALCIILQFI